MKKHIYTLCSLFFLGVAGWSQSLESAEKTYKDGDFAAAKTQYAAVLDKSSGAHLYQAQLRTAACEYGLGEFLNAAQTMYSYTLPSDTLWQARFLLYRIYMAGRVPETYRSILSKTAIDSPAAQEDKTQWTREQWQKQIDEDYRRLWELRASLTNAPIEKETLILNLKDTDTQRIPTLFDFVVNSWKDYLQENPALSVAALEDVSPHYLNDTVRLKEGTAKETTRLISQILQTASLLEGKNRQNARLFWKTDFILQPFSSSNFVFENEDAAVQNATAQLQLVINPPAATPSFWDRLKSRTISQPKTDYARSYAAEELAQMLVSQKKYAQALDVCQKAEKQLEPSYFTQMCAQIAQDITRVTLSAQENNVPFNRQQPALTFTGKNLKKVYARVYPVSYDELTRLYRSRFNRRSVNSWSEVTHLNYQDIAEFLHRQPMTEKTATVKFEQVGQAQTGTLKLPVLMPGFYVVLASDNSSFSAGQDNICGWVVNATDLAVFATVAIAADPADYTAQRAKADKTLTPDVFHIYTVDLQTGRPQPDTSLSLITDWNGSQEKAQTGQDGVADLARRVTVSAQERTNNTGYSLDILAHKDGSTAYTTNRLYFHFYNETPVQLFAQTDRPVYRPGQTVDLAVEALERLPRGLKTLANEPVQFQVEDPNGKRIFSAKATLDALGSAQARLKLAEDILLGTYSVSVQVTTGKRTYRVYHSFRVEEYKRPDYELTLSQPDKALSYGKKAVLTGSARYYMGTPLEKAKVTYTLKRKNYRPPFYWWWFGPFETEEKIVEQGQTLTDEEGNFKVTFTPTRQNEDEEFARYELHAEVYDESGRSVSATRTYKISAHPHLFKVNFAQGFYEANTPGALADIELTDADGNGVSGKVTVKAVLLENRQPTRPARQARCYNCPSQNSPLEELYKDFAAQKTAFTQTLQFQQPGAQTIQLPSLAEGVYRLELTSPQAAAQQMIFVVANEKSALKLPDVALVQHPSYYPGETMRVLLGAGDIKASKRVEIYQQNKFLTHRALLGGGVEIFSLPLTQKHRGGVALGWFGASDYVFHSAQASAEVPFDNKKLNVVLNTPKTIQPGETVNWALSVRDAANNPVNGILNLTAYDKSLDYYVANKPSLTFAQLYQQHTSAAETIASRQGPTTTGYFKNEQPTPLAFSLLSLPTLNLQMPLRVYGMNKRMSLGAAGATPMMLAAKSDVDRSVGPADAMMMSNAAQEAMTEEAAVMDDSAGVDFSKKTEQEIRSDFSETAYFNPALPVVGGKANLRFTSPQSLTTWNLFGFALTPDANFGEVSASWLTQKELMLRLQMPRFYREKDQGVIQAALTNQTRKKLTVQVSLSLTKNGTNALADFGITRAEQTVTVPAKSTHFVTWKIAVPSGPEIYQVTAVARAGTQSDAEQKSLAVLPGKMRLLASTHAALKNGANTLTLTELENVPAADVEMTALTLQPSLALSVINDMPHLLSSPYKDLVSTLNRYVPLAIVHQFYTTFPELKEAVKKLPARNGQTASWNQNDPLRLQLLEQTPWLRQAQGRQVKQADLINLFDDGVVAKQLEKEINNMTRLQNASGAFSWFAGGPDDDYLTLYALDAFAQALAYDAKIATAPAQKAFSYIVPKIENRLKQDKAGSAATVSYALYAAYTLSGYPKTWSQYKKAAPYIKKWMDYADEQKQFMTPLGQIYAAAVYHRLGETQKANHYLDLVLSRLKEDPLTGAYFAPEAQSWIWYNDTLSTQTVTLRTLVEMRPQSDKMEPMLQWLLFNRQVNDWTDTKATTQAVFTILSVMKARGALAQPSSYQISWGGQNKRVRFEPLDWTEPLQFVRSATQVTPATFSARIDKQSPQTDFASLNAIYQARETGPSPDGVINVKRTYYLRVKQDNEVKLRPISEVEKLRVGDEVEVHLTLKTDSEFEYVFVQDPKPAGFESEDLLSGWTYQNVCFYKEVKDAATHFFINWLPRGTFTLRYVLRPTVEAHVNALPAQVQSMYAPQYGAHSASAVLEIEK
ncbi:MAG: hypothetical protein J6V32_05530 [Elusimicrobiaceae bacterium]|nr:hypothetical protein [Elusimicrobiaceae bacterium]